MKIRSSGQTGVQYKALGLTVRVLTVHRDIRVGSYLFMMDSDTRLVCLSKETNTELQLTRYSLETLWYMLCLRPFSRQKLASYSYLLASCK